MILTDLFESQEIHNQDRLDQVLARCIEMVHEKNRANPKKYGRVAACIIDMKNRKVFGINLPGADGRRRHAERVAIDAYHKRYGKILPGAIIVTTLSPCNRDMEERDGPSCQDLLLQAGIEKVYSGYMDPSQHSEHPFTEETTQNDDLWRQCKELSDSFVHDDLTESEHHGMDADQVLDYVKRAHAPEAFEIEYSITDYPEWELKTIPLSQLNLDPDGEEPDPYNRVNWVDNDKVQELIPRIGSVLKSLPIVVDSEGWIIDGNHRAVAAAEAGMTSVPAYVPVKPGVAEGLDDNGISFQVQKGKNKFATTLSMGNNPVGVYQYNATTGRSIAEVYPEFKGKGLGKLLVLHAIYTATQLGLDFQEDESRTSEYDNVLDSLSSNGYIVDDDGYWYVTGEGEQYLKQSLKQDVAENFADGRVKGKSRPGRVKRSGASCDGSVTSLRAKARKYGGERGKMYHWCANMKGGKK